MIIFRYDVILGLFMPGKIVLIQGTVDYRNLSKVRRFETEYVVQKNGDNPVGRSPQQFRIIA